MTDINMSLDDYAKATAVDRKDRSKSNANKSNKSNANANKSNANKIMKANGATSEARGGRGGRGGREGTGRRARNASNNSEDQRQGRSDNVEWKHDRFDGGKRSKVAPRAQGPKGTTTVQMVDVHYDITEADLKELFIDFTKNVKIEFDENDRPTGNVNIVCENFGSAKALVRKYSKMMLDGHELKFNILSDKPSRGERGIQQTRIQPRVARSGADESRVEARQQQFSEARGRGDRRGGRGGRSRRGGRLAGEIEGKQGRREKRNEEKPKSAMELDNEMEKFAMANATPQTLDEQMAAYSAQGDGQAKEEAK